MGDEKEREKMGKLPNKHTDKYTLLMYLVDMVNQKYPELADWTQIFKNCKACKKIKIDELEKEVASIDKRVKNVAIQMKVMDEERIKMKKEEVERKEKAKKKKKKKDKEEEEKKDE